MVLHGAHTHTHTHTHTTRHLPAAAKKKARVNPAVAEMYRGLWTKRKTTGEPIGERMTVLIKPVGFLSEREVHVHVHSLHVSSWQLSVCTDVNVCAALHNYFRIHTLLGKPCNVYHNGR